MVGYTAHLAYGGNVANACRRAIEGYKEKYGTKPQVLYVRVGKDTVRTVDGIPVRPNAFLASIMVLATGEQRAR